MSNNIIQTSFAAGELSPQLFARVDLAKYHIGAAKMRNFFVDYRGGASTRPGTLFCGRALISSSAVRIIKFQFSVIQTYALEFGNLYMRVIKNGGYVLESSFVLSSVTNAAIGIFTTSLPHNFSNGDTIYFTGLLGMTQLNGRTCLVQVLTTTTFRITDLDGNNIPTTSFGTYTSGGTVARVYTLVTPYLAADLALLKFTQSADTMTFTHTSYAQRDLTRTGDASWTLTVLTFGTSISEPTGLSAVASTAGSTTYAYVVTAVGPDGQESVASARATVTGVNITNTAGYITLTWTAVVGAVYYNIYKAIIAAAASGTPVIPVGLLFGFVGDCQGVQFNDSNIVADFTTTPPLHQNPFAASALSGLTVTAGGASYTATPTVAITDPTGSGAIAIAIVSSGVIVSMVLVNAGAGYTNPTVTITNGAGSAATATAQIGPSSGMYPGVTAYFQQRKMYAATLNYPETFWGSQIGAFKNFDVANPVIDSDAITATLISQQVNNIKAMVSMPGGLIMLTGGGAWQVSGGSANAPFTPASVTAAPQAYNGCSDIIPLVVNYDILYVQEKGAIVRDLSYNFYTNIYTGADITVLSNHMFFGYQIVDWAYAEEPFKVIWTIRDDGKMLSLTYLKDQEIQGWAQHDTEGLFESVCTLTEGDEDAVYFVVRRYINGQWLRYIERMASRHMPYGVEDAWCVDCGLQYSLTYPAATVSASAATGSGVIFTASASVFVSGNVGSVLRMGNGIATITAFTDSQHLIGTITQNITDTIANDSRNMPLPQVMGNWSLTAPVTAISGLSHLEGQEVAILADGNVQPSQTVVSGAITLQPAATKITIGLAYQAQLQSLRIDTGEPTIQGKRKKINAVTLRLADTRGLAVGNSENDLHDIKERSQSVLMGTPIPLVTGDERINVPPNWSTEGQIFIEQNYPLPASVLGIIPEITIGDTAK